MKILMLAEAVLAPRSALLGQTLRTARFREKYGMNVLGVWRAGRPIRTNLGDLPLVFGDALLLQGPRDRMGLLHTEPDLILLDRGEAEHPPVTSQRKRWLAPAIMAAALILAAFNTSLVGEIMLGAALLTVLVGILTMDQAYGAIEWRSVFLVAGMLPLGLAMTKSGAASLLADKLVTALGPVGPLASLAGLFLLTTVLTQAMNGAAVATVVAPIAIHAAQQTGLDPRTLAMGVALASSVAFLTPLGHPVSVLVMGPGGYCFRDYLKVGWALTLLLFGVVMIFLPIFWPLTTK
jgi:di/tricarboxylate transporter